MTDCYFNTNCTNNKYCINFRVRCLTTSKKMGGSS